MGCNNCTNNCTCNNQENCFNQDCSCPVTLSTDCINYIGDTFGCSSVEGDQTLTEVLEGLDAYICAQFNTITNFLQIVNIGSGARVYKQTNLAGQKELRTIKSADTTLLEVEENANEITIRAGEPSLDFTANILSLIITTITDGATVQATADLSSLSTADTYVTGASFDGGTNELTITRNEGQPDIVVDLSSLSIPDVYLDTVVYDSGTNTINFTLNDSTVVSLNVDSIFTDAQIQSDYLQSDNAQPDYIQNRNPQKIVATSYALQDSDNNYHIFLDNQATDIIIDCSAITETGNYFVGFTQMGTGEVSFTNVDRIPTGSQAIIYGQNHVAAIEIYDSEIYLFGTLKVSV